jgi:hypothetical protein
MPEAASLIISEKLILPDGAIIQIRIWRLPRSSPERPHGLKYSLFYGKPGERIIGYDNEAGKGDHRHRRGTEEPYDFATLEALIDDFMSDVLKEIGHDRT